MRILLTLTTIVAATATGLAGDGEWTRWGGPDRNFVSRTTDLATSWAPGQPKTVWQRELGDGYSAILVDGQTLYTMTRRGGDEVVVALDADSGETRWEVSYPAPVDKLGDKSYGIGPRGTPSLVDGRLYTAGIGGIVHCIDVAAQKSLWHHDLVEEYGANIPNWGYSSSPLVYKDLVIVPCGGSGASVVAFDRNTGKEAWRAGQAKNSYSSPLPIKVDGHDVIVCFVADAMLGLNPDTGKQLWSYPHKTSWDINATMPVWSPEHNILMISSAYGTGARGLKLTADGDGGAVEEVWSQRRVGVQHGVMIREGDTVYCSIGMMGPAVFAAVNLPDGEVLWKERGIAKATMVKAGDQLVVLGEDGTLHLVAATPEELKIRGEREILGSRAWTVPTLVGHRLYVRDASRILALDLP